MTLPPYPGNGGTPEGEPGEGGAPQGRPGQQPPPYGQRPKGQTPYGQSQGQWGSPGGFGSYQGPNDASGQTYSGIAIAALVLSLTCVLSALGAILGVVGIFRTGRGRAKGRWMAVTAIIVGVVFTLVLVGIIYAGVWLGRQFVSPENAEVGQCVELDKDGRSVSLFKLPCSEEHDAEIFAVHQLSEQDITAFDARRLGQLEICVMAAAEDFGTPVARDVTVDGEDVRIDAVLTDPDNPGPGDNVVCYFEVREGKLEGSLTR